MAPPCPYVAHLIWIYISLNPWQKSKKSAFVCNNSIQFNSIQSSSFLVMWNRIITKKHQKTLGYHIRRRDDLPAIRQAEFILGFTVVMYSRIRNEYGWLQPWNFLVDINFDAIPVFVLKTRCATFMYLVGPWKCVDIYVKVYNEKSLCLSKISWFAVLIRLVCHISVAFLYLIFEAVVVGKFPSKSHDA